MGFFSRIARGTGVGAVFDNPSSSGVGAIGDSLFNSDIATDVASNLGIGQLLGIGAGDAEREAARVQERLAREAIETEAAARERAQQFIAPFSDVGLNAVEQASFLTSPQEQFDFIQQNPLFQLALENANRATLQGAAAGGRLGTGDTLEDLSNNVLLSAQPLISQQSQNIAGLLDFGRGVGTTQGNIAIGEGTQVGGLLQNIGDIRSAGIIGAENARTSGRQNVLNTLGALGGFA